MVCYDQCAQRTGFMWLFLVYERIKRILGMAVHAPPVVICLIRGNAKQPGTKGRASTKGLNGSKGGDEGILRYISSSVTVSKHAKYHIKCCLLVLQHQLVKCVHIPILAEMDE